MQRRKFIVCLTGFALWRAGAAGALQPEMPVLQRVGEGKYRYLAWDIYTVRLSVGHDFRADAYEKHSLRIELQYARAFTGISIAQRSIQEMRNIENFSSQQEQAWLAWMTQHFPNVKKGDRLRMDSNGQGQVQLFLNGQFLANLQDAVFARLFLGIWLNSKTSAPALRKKILNFRNIHRG